MARRRVSSCTGRRYVSGKPKSDDDVLDVVSKEDGEVLKTAGGNMSEMLLAAVLKLD